MICNSDSEYFYLYYVDFQLAVSVYISVTPIKSNASTTDSRVLRVKIQKLQISG